MKKNHLVSVIVPIYMVQDYLEKCVQSIRNQTYSNLEIILVDDGSKDACGKICDRISEEDSRVVVIHKQNGGLSDARNAGIEIAKGDYFVFIDSDDYIHPQMIELLMKPIEENRADVSVCNFIDVDDKDAIEFSEITNPAIKILSSHEDKTEYYLCERFVRFTVAWNKAYPRKFFDDIRYPKGKIHEDEFTTYKLLDKAEKVAYIDEPLYYYVQRGSSIMGEGFNEKSLYRLEAMDERIRIYAARGDYDWAEKVHFLYRLMYVQYAGQIIKDKEYDYSILRPYFRIYRELTFKNVFNFPISFKKKLGYISMALFQKLYISTHI